MKEHGIVLGLLVSFFSLFAHADVASPEDVFDGADSSGGGVAVVCKNTDGTIKTVEMLDLYEGRTIYGLNVVTQGPDMDANLDAVRKNMDTVFGALGLKKAPSQYIDKAQADIHLLPKNTDLVPVDDAAQIVTPKNCTLEQIAHYKNNSILLVNSDLWEELDELNRAALITHEAVYLHERELGDKTSQRSRKLVAYLFSDYKFASLKQDVPADANECTAATKNDPSKIAFQFYKYPNPKNPVEEVLQFTKFRGRYPYSVTSMTTPKWSWPKEDGDLFLDVDSPIELFDQVYLRREYSTDGVLQRYYFDEVNGDFDIRCAKPIDSEPAILRIVLTSNPDVVAIGAKGLFTFEVTNIGKGPALQFGDTGALSSPFSIALTGIAGNCLGILVIEPGQTCNVGVEFMPQASGVFNDTLEFKYSDGMKSQKLSFDVSGKGVSPASLTISSGPTYNFGTRAVGSSTTTTLNVTNSGGSVATQMSGGGLSAPFSFHGGSYPGTGGTCGSSLSSGAICTIVIGFVPTSTGVHNDSLEITYIAGATPTTAVRNVTGTGAAAAVLTISDSSPYDFGLVSVGSAILKTFTITNTGGTSATSMTGTGFAAPFSFNGNYYPGSKGTCYSSLVPGGSCTVVVKYTPTASGITTDSLEMSYFDGAVSQTATRDVQGTGAPPALVTISDGPTVNFGFTNPGQSVSKALTFTNTGVVSATALSVKALKAPFQFKGGSFPGTGGTCSTTLAGGSSCTVHVEFAPEQSGSYSDSLELSYNNGLVAQTATRALSGIAGQAADLTFTTGTIYDFGKAVVGSTKTLELTIVNTGGTPATNLKVGGGFAAPFGFKGGLFPGTGGTCTGTLQVSDFCTIVVVYTPYKTGSDSETLAVEYFNGNSKQIVVQYFEGTGVSTSRSTWEPWNFFAQQ